MRALRHSAFAAVLFLAHAVGAAQTVEIRRTAMSVDDSATLRVEVRDNRAPAIPRIDGLRIQETGQSSEVRSVNGATSQRTYFLYRITADRPGHYDVDVGGEAIHLDVSPAGTHPSLPATAATAETSLAFLRMQMPKRPLYVGQAVPVTLKAYFRPGSEVTLSGVPTTGLGTFTIGQLADQPQQSVETIAGTPYRVASWTAQLTAAMPGSFATHPTLPVIIRYRDVAQAMPNPLGDSGDNDDEDPFLSSSALRSFMSRSGFASGFGNVLGQVRQREMTLAAPAQTIEVKALPTVGRPALFGGAIGHFAVHASVSPSSGTAFDPLRLRIEVTGAGSFDRVTPFGIAADGRDWKVYPPTSVTTATINAKTFEQAIVPQHGGQLAVPTVAFPYFDPDKQAYMVASAAPMTITVAPSTLAPAVSSVAPEAPLATATKMPAWTLPKIFRQRRFWSWTALAITLLIAGLVLVAVTRRKILPLVSRGARRRAVRAQMAGERVKMREAARAHDAARFFRAAQTTLQQRLAAIWTLAPDDITAAEVTARLGNGAIAESLAAAEALRYGGITVDPATLEDCARRLQTELEQLDRSPYRF